VNVTPALPNPYKPPPQPDRTAVGAVCAGRPMRDAVDAREQQPAGRSMDTFGAADRTQLVATRYAAYSTHASRALASYARVAGDGEHHALREMLGFDAYA